jgi:Tol biopolymer transport system component/DNA-binding winged helix-turn-helix (wHTH) protein
MNAGGHGRLAFGAFELDTGRKILRSVDSDDPISLTPRLLDTLLFLVEHAGELVEKRTLLDAVWPSVVVEENNLTQAVSALRRALGERPGERAYIETVPGRGYRFVAEVRAAGSRADPPERHQDSRRTGGALARLSMGARAGMLAALIVAAVTAVLILRPMTQVDAPPASALLANHVRISAPPGNHSQPTLSPDGSRVAFVSDEAGVPQIHVQSLLYGESRPITFDEDLKGAPSWSPVDDRIIFTKYRGIAPLGIWWVDTLGTREPQRLIELAGNGNYSRDGGTIVFERGTEIWLADADGRNQRRVDGMPARDWWSEWAYPSLSPDGSLITFYLQHTGLLGNIWIIPAAGGDARPLTQERQHMGKPVWAPDGRYVYFSSRRGGTWNLWRVSVEGGDPEAVTCGVGEDRSPAISRDGEMLVYENTRTASQFKLTNPWTGETDSLGSDGHLSWFPNVSHDGTQFAYFAELAPREQVFVMNVDGTGRRQITFGDPDEVNVMPRWSHDDEHLYFHENLRARALKKVPIEGGPGTVFFSEFAWEDNMWLQASPAGDRVAFVRVPPEGQPRRVVIRDIAGGAETVLDAQIWSLPQWSKDGTEILGMGHDGVALCDSDGTACDVLHEGDNLAPQWSRDGTQIFFTKPVADSPAMRELWAMDRDGGNVRDLNVVLGPTHGQDGPFQVAAGDRILWNEHTRADSQIWKAELID